MSSADRHEIIKSLAYELWMARGRPIGTPEIDWIQAERMLNAEHPELPEIPSDITVSPDIRDTLTRTPLEASPSPGVKADTETAAGARTAKSAPPRRRVRKSTQ